MTSTSRKLVATLLWPTFSILSVAPPAAMAWKPRTHALTANDTLVDAADGHICMPGLSSTQIPIGETPLVGTYEADGEIVPFNDLGRLGPYVRAGAMGPDAWPDAAFGQLAIHVDHSRQTPGDPLEPDFVKDLDGPTGWLICAEGEDCEELKTLDLTRFVLGEQLYYSLIHPLANFNPRWRSIDYGHEVMKAALGHNQWALAGRPREEILATPGLRALHAERQAAIAFAYGYLMHFAGDSQAHTWINELVGQPFSLLTGRMPRSEYLDPQIGAAAAEELAHMAIEKYVDVRYRPEPVAASCTPADPSFAEDATSVCDGGAIEMPIDCDLCNPLRAGTVPPDGPLSDMCDSCFAGCNPWREICPVQVATDLPCAECKGREDDLAICDQTHATCLSNGGDADQCLETRSSCVRSVEERCSIESEAACCEELVGVLVRSDILSEAEAAEYSCLNPAVPGPRDVAALFGDARAALQDALAGEALETYREHAPNGCYQGPLDALEGVATQVTGPGGEVIEVSDELGLDTDLNGDGETDLINECMLWNCLQSPGACPLRALRRGAPQLAVGDELMCDDVVLSKVITNPDPLLNTHGIALPRNVYKEIFLERRYPEHLPTGALGTFSLGGYVPNSIYTMTDMMKVSADALDALRRPLPYIVDECVVDGSAECELAAKIGLVRAAIESLRLHVPLLRAAGIAALLLPFGVGIPVALAAFATIAVIEGSWLVVKQGLIPGMTMPLRAKREELLAHLEDRWYEVVYETAQAMSGESCTQGCGGLFPAEENCTDHRFLGMHNYFDFALEAYDIVDGLDCRENNYWTLINDAIAGEDELSPWQILDLVESGGTIILTQWLGCEALNYLYTQHLLPELETMVADMVLEQAATSICQVSGFYVDLAGQLAERPEFEGAQGDAWQGSCRAAIVAAYGDTRDPIQMVRALRELTAALDNGGLTDSQKDALYPQLEREIMLATGVEVDLWAVDDAAEILECSATAEPIIGEVPVRKWVIATLEPLVGPDATATLEAFDRELGYWEQVVADGIDALNPIPLDLEKFHPMYNTLQLNKLTVLGDGSSSCKTRLYECFARGKGPSCLADYKDCEADAQNDAPTGLRALAAHGNADPLGGGFAAAYTSEPIDLDPETFLSSFFQSQGYQVGEASSCKAVGWNIMCNSVYSLDDPDDYCRDLERWDPAYFDGVADAGGVIPECGPALGSEGVPGSDEYKNSVDEYALDNDRARYQPDPRARMAPSEEPRPEQPGPWMSQLVVHPEGLMTWESPHRSAHHHRMYVDRVVTQDFARSSLPDWLARADDPIDSYYPYESTRFALANKDAHVARLYANVLAPYYCPEMGANQSDWDCDTIPDSCDNCPQTYNPDQLDSNRDGAGDDCRGYSPATGYTPPEARWSLCPSKQAKKVWDGVLAQWVKRWIVGAGDTAKLPWPVGKLIGK